MFNLLLILSSCTGSLMSTEDSLFFENFEREDMNPWEYGNENSDFFSWFITKPDNYDDYMLQFLNEGLFNDHIASANTEITQQISLKNEYYILQYEAIIPNKPVCSYGCISLFSGANKANLQEVVRFGPGICRKDQNENYNYNILFSINGNTIVDEQATGFNLNDLKSHVYTLVIKPSGEYKILIDFKSFKTGTLTNSQKSFFNNVAEIKRIGFRNYNSDQNEDSPYYFNNIKISQSEIEEIEPEETKPEETKPEETKSEVTRSEITKSEVTKSEVTKSEVTKSEVTKSEVTKSEVTKSEVTQSKDTKSVETQAVETKSETFQGALGQDDSLKGDSVKTDKSSKGSSPGLIIGIIIAGVAVIAVGAIVFVKIRKTTHNEYNEVTVVQF